MAVLDRFVLPPDVVIQPVARLPAELRERVGHKPGDYSVTRPRSRTTSSIVDRRTAALLEAFRAPTTIVDAVIAFSASEGVDPRATLDDAFEVLGDFVNGGLLVPADSELARTIDTSLATGDRLGPFEVVEPVHVVVDTEVYRARAGDGSAVALKVARPGADARVCAAFAHEAAILGRLDGRVNPEPLELGDLDGRPFLAVSWCAGVDVQRAATETRGLGGPVGRRSVLELAQRVIEAYAHLHAQGVLHGDVYPRNVLVDAYGAVTVVDYGLAAMPGTESPIGRGGVDLFLEPEVAAARLAGERPPPPSAAGEQYSLGALVYLLLTGAHTHAFSVEREEMLQHLLERSPLPFAHHGVHDMPAVESTIARALAKDPHERYRSVSYLLRFFRAAAARDGRRAPKAHRPDSARRLLDDVLGRLELPGELYAAGLPAPTASAMNGAAGIAYALLRVAEIRDDERLLAIADVWSTRALSEAASHNAFWNVECQIVPEIFGSNSFYHHASGLHCVEALIAQARGDEPAHERALESFVAAAGEPCEHLDVMFGRAGLLLGCCAMLEATPTTSSHELLRTRGDALRDSIWTQLEHQPPLADGIGLRSLGVAHGWAGYLFALLRWSEGSGTPLPAGLVERLDQLAYLGRPAGRGLRWPPEPGAPTLATGLTTSWCNGAAGHVHLWALAHRRLGDERYARLAQMAAWAANDAAADAPGDLCCGLAGRAYALLSLHRQSGEPEWLARARRVADRAATEIRIESLRRDSLYKGEIGVALLAADLEAPAYARMPLFGG